MVVRISDKTQNYSKVTKLLVKPFIKNLGADVGQGYFYGRPLSISAFNDLIETK